jgi:hypothetical protein
MWRASVFEVRHPVLIYQTLLAASVLTYLADPEDVVWRYIKNTANVRVLEHLCFATAAVALGAGACLCTLATAKELSERTDSGRVAGAGEILRAIGIGSLLPLAGFLVLICGEMIRVGRREGLRIHIAQERGVSTDDCQKAAELKIFPSHSLQNRSSAWRQAARIHLGAWFAFLSMIVFSAMLVDRVAEVLFATTLLVSLLVHWDTHRRALAWRQQKPSAYS